MFDFGIGSSELVIIAVIALIVIGPKDLPKVLRTIGQFTSKMRSMAREFQRHLDEATREAGLDEVKKDVNKMTNFTVTDLDKTGDDLKKAIEETSPKPAESGNGAAAGKTAEASKPAESKPAESKPAESKAGKSKAAESKPAASAVAANEPAAADKAGKAAG